MLQRPDLQPLADEAGETTAQNGGFPAARAQTFEAQWDFASTVPGAEQSGLAVVASPDRGDGARMKLGTDGRHADWAGR